MCEPSEETVFLTRQTWARHLADRTSIVGLDDRITTLINNAVTEDRRNSALSTWNWLFVLSVDLPDVVLPKNTLMLGGRDVTSRRVFVEWLIGAALDGKHRSTKLKCSCGCDKPMTLSEGEDQVSLDAVRAYQGHWVRVGPNGELDDHNLRLMRLVCNTSLQGRGPSYESERKLYRKAILDDLREERSDKLKVYGAAVLSWTLLLWGVLEY